MDIEQKYPWTETRMNGKKYLSRRLVRLVGLIKLHHIIKNEEHPGTFSRNYSMPDALDDLGSV
jgi:hypothetical protein